jgi:hypothetical protein
MKEDIEIRGKSCRLHYPSDYPYDRIIVTAGVREDNAREAGVFRFDAAYGPVGDDAEKVSEGRNGNIID